MDRRRGEWMMRAIALVVACSVACGGPEAPPGDDDAGPGLDAARADASGTCASDGECDDGLFCNGAETCAPGATGADARGCRAGAPPCPAPRTCDEREGRCGAACDVTDADGDGRDAAACGGDDCDDADRNRFPGNPEVCDASDHDEDCDPTTYGFRDVDGDGTPDAACCNVEADGTTMHCGADCDDARPGVHPSAPEVCNGVDDDCDGASDEGVQEPFWVDADRDGYGDDDLPTVDACSAPPGHTDRGGDCDDMVPGTHVGATEVCNAVDDDCDGSVDERLSCDCTDADTMRACPQPGICASGTQTCTRGSWSACTVSPAAETCNGRDDDCDGTVDGAVAAASCAPGPNQRAVCTAGACVYSCEGTYRDCTAAAGCETDSDTSVAHCGACGRACATVANGSRACLGGACRITSCAMGFADCDMVYANGCERSLRTVSDCGGCGAACLTPAHATATCLTSGCSYACTAPYLNCDTAWPNGCEIDPRTDVANCGGCGTRCTAPANGTATCAASTCGFTCNAGYVQSGASCVRPGAPFHVSPLTDQVVTSRRPLFRFRLGASSDRVRVEVCRDAACTMSVRSVVSAAAATSVALDLDLAPGTYYWRGFGRSGTTENPTPSASRRFITFSRAATADATVGQTFFDVAGNGGNVALGMIGITRVSHYRAVALSGIDERPDQSIDLATAPGYGVAVAAAGDVNGDGYGDLIVGACQTPMDGVSPPDTTICANRAYVFHGTATDLLAEPFATEITAPSGENGFGYSVAGAGDVNGDGYADVIVGAYYTNRAFVYFGSASGISTASPLVLGPGGSGTGPGYFGVSVAGAGDVDADGFGDVIVGQPLSGRAHLYFGSTSPSAAATRVIDSFVPATNFGLSVAGAGDVNGDGRPDVVIGGNGTPAGSPMGSGIVAVYSITGSGAARTLTPRWTWAGDTAMSNRGISVSGPGDVNGDGLCDVLAGASGSQQAFVYPGTTSATRPAALWTITSTQANFGRFVGVAGLLAGDAIADLLIFGGGMTGSSSGRGYVWRGRSSGAPGATPEGALLYCQGGVTR